MIGVGSSIIGQGVSAGRLRVQEAVAILLTLGMLIAVPFLVLRHAGSGAFAGRVKMFDLTGIADQGRWTLEEVNGLNYWWKTFVRAEIRVEPGDTVILQLHSSDVTHGFYAPTLGLGPVLVEPGHVQVVTFVAGVPGVHYYYCTSICGRCHYFMKGMILVGTEAPAPGAESEMGEACLHHVDPPADGTPAEHGRYLFQTMGCVACHGMEGRGDVVNPNYVNRTVPRLNRLAHKLFLDDPVTLSRVRSMIEQRKTPEEMEAMGADLPRFNRVVSQYRTVRDVIRNGRTPARVDTVLFVPPLAMPSWKAKLAESDIDDILVYLFDHQAPESEEE